eukprot:TRINITY_DN4762_c0_g1_i1.p1 TRINITY_DN4762_c0_g1~~TRINITY_DN4762_c0_g1_i1.p1  ORF type:complete len:287 (-),score=37.46 TRINITY_DN4762_c0_g1_i1:219-1079(-)
MAKKKVDCVACDRSAPRWCRKHLPFAYEYGGDGSLECAVNNVIRSFQEGRHAVVTKWFTVVALGNKVIDGNGETVQNGLITRRKKRDGRDIQFTECLKDNKKWFVVEDGSRMCEGPLLTPLFVNISQVPGHDQLSPSVRTNRDSGPLKQGNNPNIFKMKDRFTRFRCTYVLTATLNKLNGQQSVGQAEPAAPAQVRTAATAPAVIPPAASQVRTASQPALAAPAPSQASTAAPAQPQLTAPSVAAPTQGRIAAAPAPSQVRVGRTAAQDTSDIRHGDGDPRSSSEP